MEEKNNSKSDVYELITNRIIAKLEQGVVPWRIPWTQAGLPKNLISNRPYRGINIWTLASLGYRQNLFLSYKQVKSLGGSIIKGQKACPVILWKWNEKQDERTKEITKIGILRYYMVFNIEQCEGITIVNESDVEVLEPPLLPSCEEIIEGYATCPLIEHRGSEAYYNRINDTITMPFKKAFMDSDHYYSTLFHEMVHSTGHPNRLNRKELTESTKFGSEQYSQEELVAEMGASFLTSLAGIGDKPFDNHVAYIQNWLEVLENDKRCIVYASGKAQKAVDYILGNTNHTSGNVEAGEVIS